MVKNSVQDSIYIQALSLFNNLHSNNLLMGYRLRVSYSIIITIFLCRKVSLTSVLWSMVRIYQMCLL